MNNLSFKSLGIDPHFPGMLDLTLLRDYIESIDHSIEALTERYTEKELIRYGDYDDPCEVNYIYQVADGYLPNAVKMPLVVTAYTCLESSIEQLLNYAKEKEGKAKSYKDVEGKSSVNKYQKYITNELKLNFKFKEEVKSNISDMNKFRNCIAHANGNLKHWPDNKVQELKLISERLNGKYDTDIYVGYDLRISTAFLKWCLDVTNNSVKPLEDCLKQRYKLRPYHM
ncbi:hypothetical protein [Oceanospirillum sediminis]|uniref:Uncharacterized protein n=1 Tax=Oceanospirillum sediminis TaxID=2760088 RepID=A0A839IJN3_9GAMM|nr:hypothetical protein [Oceanospirillum sediminis]MBB1485138.1 hypothetical protein [Oceanospirillum sediminis]